MLRLPEKLENKLQKLLWMPVYFEDGTIEFRKYPYTGEEFKFLVDQGEDMYDLCDNVQCYIDEFEEDCDDSDWCVEVMEELLHELENYRDENNSHYKNDDGIRTSWELEDLLSGITDILESFPPTSLCSPEESKLYAMMENLRTYMENNM